MWLIAGMKVVSLFLLLNGERLMGLAGQSVCLIAGDRHVKGDGCVPKNNSFSILKLCCTHLTFNCYFYNNYNHNELYAFTSVNCTISVVIINTICLWLQMKILLVVVDFTRLALSYVVCFLFKHNTTKLHDK